MEHSCGRRGRLGQTPISQGSGLTVTSKVVATSTCRVPAPYLVFCDNLEEWDEEGGGREVQEGRDICIPMADLC